MERVKEGGGGGEERKETRFLPSPPPPPYLIFSSLSPFSARAKHQNSRSLLPNPPETLATQAKRHPEASFQADVRSLPIEEL